MTVFFALTFVIIACWGTMFYSQVYRFTFLDWPYFAGMTIASFVVLILAFLFGMLCWTNFNKGLAQYCMFPNCLRSRTCHSFFGTCRTTQCTPRSYSKAPTSSLTSSRATSKKRMA